MGASHPDMDAREESIAHCSSLESGVVHGPASISVGTWNHKPFSDLVNARVDRHPTPR